MAPPKKPVTQDSFQTRQLAYDWLTENGYRRGKSTFYADVKNGFPPSQQDGSIHRADLLAYSRTIDKTTAVADSSLQNRRELAETEKAEHDCRIAKTKADNAERRLSTEWAHREEVWSTIAAILGTLYTAITHNAGAAQQGIIRAVAGNLARGPQLSEQLTDFIDRSFNEVSAVTKIDACFYREDESGAIDTD